MWWVAAVYAAAAGWLDPLPDVGVLIVEDEELLIRLLVAIRTLLDVEPQAPAVAAAMLAALEDEEHLPPIVAEGRDNLAREIAAS